MREQLARRDLADAAGAEQAQQPERPTGQCHEAERKMERLDGPHVLHLPQRAGSRTLRERYDRTSFMRTLLS